MCLLSDNVIPGKHGKVFGTNAENREDLIKIQSSISQVKGIKDIIMDDAKFPRELTVDTNAIVSVEDIEKTAIEAGFNVNPKTYLSYKI